jgi:hypothetical protein
MTKDELAAMLNGREYGSEMTRDEERTARQNRLLVAYGDSDDNLEVRGVMNDEFGAYEGCECYLVRVSDRWERLSSGTSPVLVEAIWAPKDDTKLSWLITSPIPHSTFDIMEDSEPFCRGIVIDQGDMIALINGGWSVSDDEMSAALAVVDGAVEGGTILSILTAAAKARNQ